MKYKMRVLYLHLKKKYFGMIRSGEKNEEYRKLNKYYKSLLTLTLFDKKITTH